MNCVKCGQQVSDTARFCPDCGKPVGGVPERRATRGKLFAILGMVGLLVVVSAAVWLIKRPQTGGSAVALQTQPPGVDSVKMPPPQISRFDWTGLSPEQLQSARAALDEAIAKEERSRSNGKDSP